MPADSARADGGGGLRAAIDRAVAVVENVFNGIAALVIFAMMFFMVAEVLARKLINSPIPGAIDWVEVAMASFAFLGAAYCQRYGGHVRMELIVSRLRGRVLWLAEALAVLIGAFYITVIAWKSFIHFLRAYEIGDTTIDLQLPLWPSKLIVPVALTLLTIRLLIQFWGYMRLAADPTRPPVAVPLIEDAHTQARQEVEEVMGAEHVSHDDDGNRDGGRR